MNREDKPVRNIIHICMQIYQIQGIFTCNFAKGPVSKVSFIGIQILLQLYIQNSNKNSIDLGSPQFVRSKRMISKLMQLRKPTLFSVILSIYVRKTIMITPLLITVFCLNNNFYLTEQKVQPLLDKNLDLFPNHIIIHIELQILNRLYVVMKLHLRPCPQCFCVLQLKDEFHAYSEKTFQVKKRNIGSIQKCIFRFYWNFTYI